MRSIDLSRLTVGELLERFVQLSLQEDDAAKIFRVSRVNRLIVQVNDVTKELQRRSGDQRMILSKLFSHPNAQVRFNVATNLFNLIPQEARRHIEEIAAGPHIDPITGHAGTYLLMLDGLPTKQAGVEP